MKLKLDRITLLKFACLLILMLAIAMGAVELIFLVDLGGIDFAVTFLLVYFAAVRDAIIFKYRAIREEISRGLNFLSELYLFRPMVFVSHASASAVLIAFTCSALLACMMWIPLIYVSSGFIV